MMLVSVDRADKGARVRTKAGTGSHGSVPPRKQNGHMESKSQHTVKPDHPYSDPPSADIESSGLQTLRKTNPFCSFSVKMKKGIVTSTKLHKLLKNANPCWASRTELCAIPQR